jgi:hypothetical protein
LGKKQLAVAAADVDDDYDGGGADASAGTADATFFCEANITHACNATRERESFSLRKDPRLERTFGRKYVEKKTVRK